MLERLCVFCDAGETNALMPVLKDWESKGLDFKVLVMATAETIIKPEMFEKRRVTLKELGIHEQIDSKTDRTTKLSEESLKKIHQIKARVVLVGMASEIQAQVLNEFKEVQTLAYADNSDYDTKNISFQTVRKVQKVAQKILCPSQEVKDQLKLSDDTRTYHVVGKPSLQEWKKEIAGANKDQVLEKLKLKNNGVRIVSFIGGYGEGYEVVNKVFDDCITKLNESNFQAFLQPHPKDEMKRKQLVKTPEALAVSDVIVGYNSTVVYDSYLIGKKVLYIIPDKTTFNHFAIDRGEIAKVQNERELLDYLKKQDKKDQPTAKDPGESISVINNLIDQMLV